MVTRMLQIAPSILSADITRLAEDFESMHEAGVDWMHFDVMDNHFVPNLTFGPPVVNPFVRRWPGRSDIHLMITEPETLLPRFLEAKPHCITFHVESTDNLEACITQTQARGVLAGISLRPSTKIQTIEPYLDQVDLVLVMTVEPGFSGQSMVEDARQRVPWLNNWRNQHGGRFVIEADGGLKLDNLEWFVRHGLDVAVMGSGFFDVDLTPKAFMEKVRDILQHVSS